MQVLICSSDPVIFLVIIQYHLHIICLVRSKKAIRVQFGKEFGNLQPQNELNISLGSCYMVGCLPITTRVECILVMLFVWSVKVQWKRRCTHSMTVRMLCLFGLILFHVCKGISFFAVNLQQCAMVNLNEILDNKKMVSWSAFWLTPCHSLRAWRNNENHDDDYNIPENAWKKNQGSCK